MVGELGGCSRAIGDGKVEMEVCSYSWHKELGLVIVQSSKR